METRTIALLALAGMVALAGCSGGPGNGTATPDDGSDTLDASATGTVNFYVSDQPGALEDFRTLNVTITRVGFKPAGTNTSNESANESGWQEYDINDTTVDLTQLVGPNATLLDSIDVPNGSYEKVFAYTGEVNGTLTDGTSQTVRIPSEKLQMNNNFTVEANESVDFVFDIQVVRAGNSGRYNVRPVISQSGTDRDIREVDARTGNRSGNGGMREESADDGTDQTETTTESGGTTQSAGMNASSGTTQTASS